MDTIDTHSPTTVSQRAWRGQWHGGRAAVRVAPALALALGMSFALGAVADDAALLNDPDSNALLPRSLYRLPGSLSGEPESSARVLGRVAQQASRDRLDAGQNGWYGTELLGAPTLNRAVLWSGQVAGYGPRPGTMPEMRMPTGRTTFGAGSGGMPGSSWIGVDRDSLSKALYGGVIDPIDATNVRQERRASQSVSLPSTAAVSLPSTQSSSISQSAVPFIGHSRAMRPGASAATLFDAPPASAIEDPARRAHRLREIARQAR
jgi:hypothetical protein